MSASSKKPRAAKFIQSDEIPAAPLEYWVIPHVPGAAYVEPEGKLDVVNLKPAQLTDATWKVKEIIPWVEAKPHTAIGIGPIVVNMVNVAFPNWEMSVATDERIGAEFTPNDVVMCAPLLARPQSSGYLSGAQTDVWTRLFTKVKFVPSSPPTQGVLDVPVIKLHCPKLEGCEATYRRDLADTTSREMSVSILGIGGGVGQSFKTTMKREFSARGRCMQLTRRVRVELVAGHTYVGDDLFSIGFRINVVAIERYPEDSPVPRESDFCDVPLSTLRNWEKDGRCDVEPVRRSKAPKDQSKRIEGMGALLEGMTTFGVDLDSNVFNLPVNLKFQVTREVSETLEVDYSLAPGTDYYTYLPEDESGAPLNERCWSIAS